MSVNKKILMASVGVLMVLVLSVLLIRDPAKPPPKKAELPKNQTEATIPIQVQQDDSISVNNYDERHQKVAQIVDETTDVVAKTLPNLWERIKDAGEWFMKFDTKHALILAGSGLFLGSIIIGGRSKNKN